MSYPRHLVFCLCAAGVLAAFTLLPWGPLEVFELKTVDVRMWVRERLAPPAPRSLVQTLVLDDAALATGLWGGAEAESLRAALDAIVTARMAAPGVLGLELPLWHPVATPLFRAALHAALPARERSVAGPDKALLVVGVHSGRVAEELVFGREAVQLMPLDAEAGEGRPRVGAADFDGDNDGVVRRVPLVVEREGLLYPSFVLQLVAAHDGVRVQDIQLRRGRVLELRRAATVVRRIPVDDRGRVLVNYRERPPAARHSVLAVSAAADARPAAQLLGTSARGVTESHSVPLGGRAANLEVTAEALQTILSGQYIHRVGRLARFLLTWGFLFAGSLGMVRLPSWRGVALGFGIVLAYTLIEKSLFLQANVWLPFVLPVTVFTWGAAIFPVYGFRWRAKRHMEEMRLMRRFDDLVLMNIAGGLIVADRYGMVVRHNPRAAELLDRGGEAFHGQHVRELFAISPAMLELLGQVMHTSHGVPAPAAFPSSRRVVVPSRSGASERTFELEVALVDPEILKLRSPRHADLPCYELTFDDVTQQVLRAQEEARRARLAAVGEIAAKLGHEIRNSLGGLRLFLDNMRDEIAPASRAARAYTSMVREIEFLQRKIDELREFGQDPRHDLEQTPIKEVLDEALAYASSKLSDKHIRVVLECERSLRPLTVDRRRLREAFQNLIHNAIEAAPEGGRVAIQVEQEAGGNGVTPGTVQVHIEDNGPGIPPETREHVFSLFFTTKPNIGTGLGLPIAKKIVESHGGQISFTCGPRGGTRFTVSLPAVREVEDSR